MFGPASEMFIDNSDYYVIASVTALFLYYSISFSAARKRQIWLTDNLDDVITLSGKDGWLF